MSESVSIPREQLEQLRYHVDEAMKILASLDNHVLTAPELTASQKRIHKFERMITTGESVKKPAHLKKGSSKK